MRRGRGSGEGRKEGRRMGEGGDDINRRQTVGKF